MVAYALSSLGTRATRSPAEDGWVVRDALALSRPGTCLERGVAAPFTAPALHAARVRAAPSGGVEVVVPNPSGREGWFVLPWSAVLERFQPSLADRALVRALGLERPMPASLRAAAWRVAAEGLSGRAARRAAEATARRGPPALPSRLARIESFLGEVAQTAREAASEPDRRHAHSLHAFGCAALAAAVQQPTAEGMGPERREWLLDGWELLAASWCAASLEQRPSVLRRAAALAPPVPLEAEGWAGGDVLAAAGSPRGGAAGGAIAQEVAEAAFARWLGG
jgi:hypothetical protein